MKYSGESANQKLYSNILIEDVSHVYLNAGTLMKFNLKRFQEAFVSNFKLPVNISLLQLQLNAQMGQSFKFNTVKLIQYLHLDQINLTHLFAFKKFQQQGFSNENWNLTHVALPKILKIRLVSKLHYDMRKSKNMNVLLRLNVEKLGRLSLNSLLQMSSQNQPITQNISLLLNASSEYDLAHDYWLRLEQYNAGYPTLVHFQLNYEDDGLVQFLLNVNYVPIFDFREALLASGGKLFSNTVFKQWHDVFVKKVILPLLDGEKKISFQMHINDINIKKMGEVSKTNTNTNTNTNSIARIIGDLYQMSVLQSKYLQVEKEIENLKRNLEKAYQLKHLHTVQIHAALKTATETNALKMAKRIIHQDDQRIMINNKALHLALQQLKILKNLNLKINQRLINVQFSN